MICKSYPSLELCTEKVALVEEENYLYGQSAQHVTTNTTAEASGRAGDWRVEEGAASLPPPCQSAAVMERKRS